MSPQKRRVALEQKSWLAGSQAGSTVSLPSSMSVTKWDHPPKRNRPLA